MARCTVIHDAGMVKHRWFKGAGQVTEAAVLCGRKVADIHPGSYWCRRRIITVTCGAVTHNASMIKSAIGEIIANGMA